MAGESFGSLLRAHRARSGLSQEALAERAAVSSAAIGALEQGKRRAPYAYTVGRLSEALNLSPGERREFEAVAERARSRPKVTGARGGLPRDNLPVILSPFLERPETADVAEHLSRGRLLTVAGSGGIGKTRTAIEAAKRVADRYPDGIRFFDLSEIADPGAVTGVLAALFEARFDTAADALGAVVSALGRRRALLLIDNCEHLLGTVAPLVEALLRECPELAILATSREPLGIAGESVYRLPPLRDADAVELFLTRARAEDARATFAAGRMRLVAEICDRLDGIPLAIELAAGRLPTLGLTTLARRLGTALQATSLRDRPPRQQTMDATIAWSYALLDERERTLLRRLCIFAGGFTLEAAEQVCSGGDLEDERIESSLSQLVSKSLVDGYEAGDRTRFTLLEPIRAFAWQRLDERGERDETCRRHARWMADVAEYRYAKRWTESLAEYLPEIENARAAIARCRVSRASEDTLLAARILTGFRVLVEGRYPKADLLVLETTLLERIDRRAHPALALRLIWALLRGDASDEPAVLAANLAQAFELCERTGDAGHLVMTQTFGALVYARRGSLTEADELLERAGALCANGSLEDVVCGTYLFSRAWIRSVEGRAGEAREDLLRIFRETQEPPSDTERFNILIILCEVECAARRYDVAARHARELLESDALRPDQRFVILGNLASYELLLGDGARAAEHARLTLCSPLARLERATPIFLEVYAGALAMEGRPSFAARILGFVDEWYRRKEHERVGADVLVHDVVLTSLRGGLSQREIRTHAAAGALATLDGLLAEIAGSPAC